MSPEARIQALRDAPPGGWVAFSEDESRVVAYGQSYDEAVVAAEQAGEKEPVLTKVPLDWAVRVFAC
jgi:predicted RNase H-like HicB family nuclease